MKAIVFALALAASRASCPSPNPSPAPGPPPHTSPDAGTDSGVGPETNDGGDVSVIPADVYDSACASMRVAGCIEGFHPECSHMLWLIVKRKLLWIDAACVARCSSPSCVKSCGQISCDQISEPL